MVRAQLDMFAEPEAELFTPQPAIAYPDEGRVRVKLARMLDELRLAGPSLDRARRAFVEQVVPQMSLALPEDERRQVQAEFAAELARLG